MNTALQEKTIEPKKAHEKMPHRSESIGKLAAALAKAQSEIKNAAKDKNNPFFKSNYADLASVWDACREALSKNELAVTQPLTVDEHGRIYIITELLHSSGEWISSIVPVISVKQDPQSIGSAISYFRRFALSPLVGVAPAEKPHPDDQDEEDDGNLASAGGVGVIDSFGPPPGHPAASASHAAPVHQPAATQSHASSQNRNDRKPTEAQIGRLFAIQKKAEILDIEIKDYIKKTWNRDSRNDLSLKEYDEICNLLSSGAFPKNNVVNAPSQPENKRHTSLDDLEWYNNQPSLARKI